MAITTPLIIAIVVFIVYLLLKKLNQISSDIFLFILFFFAYPNINKNLATFYLFGLIFVMIIDLTNQNFQILDINKLSFGDFKFSGYLMTLVSLAIGSGFYFIINTISIRQGASILGVPSLGIVDTGEISALFLTTYTGMLAIIENRFIFTIFNFLAMIGKFLIAIPFIGFLFALGVPFMPLILAGLLFGVLHLTAFSLSFGLIIWAAAVMWMWLIWFFITGDDLAPNFSHWLWNIIISVGRGLQIVT